MNDKLRRAIKTGIIDEDYKDYLAVEKIPHDFSEKYEQRIGELIKTNRKSGHRHIKITLRFAAAIIAAVLAVGSVTVAAVPPLREWFVGVFVQDNNRNAEITHIKDNLAFIILLSMYRHSYLANLKSNLLSLPIQGMKYIIYQAINT